MSPMLKYFATPLLVAMFVMSDLAWAQKKEKVKELLLDNFEDSNLVCQLGTTWIAATDRDEGGSSEALLDIAGSGYFSKKAIHVSYQRGSRYQHKTQSIWKDAFAALALLMGEQFGRTRDLSPYHGLSFEAKGQGAFSVLIICQGQNGMQIFYVNLTHEENGWKKMRVAFSDLRLLGEEKTIQTSDLHAVLLIGVSHIADETPDHGEFWLDDVALWASGDARPETRHQIEEIRFGNLLLYKPSIGWTWQPEKEISKLVAELRATTMVFIGIPMLNRNRIPFSDGLSADPGNPRELLECTLYELRKLGFQNLQALDNQQVRLKYFPSQRFVLRGEFSSASLEQLKPLGIKSNRAYVEVDFLKYKSTTYEIVSFLPEELKKEMLPQIHAILDNLSPHQESK
jgi:hypothetical protein